METTLKMNAGITIQKKNQTLDLHPSGALFWLEASALVIADLHLMPQASQFKITQKEHLEHFANSQLKTLERAIEQYSPQRVWILGEITGIEHKPINLVLANWLRKRTEEFTLIKSLDPQQLSYYQKLNVSHYSHFQRGPFYLSHTPSLQMDYFTFCGQVQPGVMIEGLKSTYQLFPCFYVNYRQIILPSFGGQYARISMEPQLGVDIYPLGLNQIHRYAFLQSFN